MHKELLKIHSIGCQFEFLKHFNRILAYILNVACMINVTFSNKFITSKMWEIFSPDLVYDLVYVNLYRFIKKMNTLYCISKCKSFNFGKELTFPKIYEGRYFISNVCQWVVDLSIKR